MANPSKLILCPYCGSTQTEPEDRCAACGGYFDSLSLKVTQQHMGPWFIRDRHHPFRPGCSYDVLTRQIDKGKVRPTTILKGPTTRQFWSVARNVPGVAHLLGYCHACGAHCQKTDEHCGECGEVFFTPKLRDNLGLAPMGSDVQPQPKMTETGTYEAIQTRPEAGAAQRPAAAAAAAPPTTDQPVGSSILAGLRSEPESQGQPAGAGPGPSGGAGGTPDALAWLTATGEEEPDTLNTAGQSDGAAELPAGGSRPGAMTWLLIGINVLLFAIVIAAAVFIIGRGVGDKPEQPIPPPPVDTTDDELLGEDFGADRATIPATDDTDDADPIADPGATDLNGNPPPADDDADAPDDNLFAEPDDDAPKPDDAARERLAERLREARRLENDGELDKAMNVLREIKQHAPASQHPADLDQAIERVRQKLKDQELDDFFG